ncbi:DNA adenine methylase [Paenibacillus wenxiniae]|uniref:DNA adenine methylase n=1 Tax=Paenibacillus wenxiniae TaxID=1636843 RepID=A0ABW4RDB0_9BACL
MKAPRILHYPGSKWSMVDWIISYMPQHNTYLEPYFGSGAVLFNKEPSKLETVNDLDSNVVHLFRMIRDRPEELAQAVRFTPYARQEYMESYHPGDDINDIEKARLFLVRCWMARGAKTSDRTGWRHNISVDHCPNKPITRQWTEMPDKIMQITERLAAVQIESQPAVKLLERYRRDDVLVYADPPYILQTRSKRMYKHEMNNDDHMQLLDTLDAHPGPVLLSGYDHQLYNERLRHWNRSERIVQAEAGKKRTEVLWINPVAAAAANQAVLF